MCQPVNLNFSQGIGFHRLILSVRVCAPSEPGCCACTHCFSPCIDLAHANTAPCLDSKDFSHGTAHALSSLFEDHTRKHTIDPNSIHLCGSRRVGSDYWSRACSFGRSSGFDIPIRAIDHGIRDARRSDELAGASRQLPGSTNRSRRHGCGQHLRQLSLQLVDPLRD